MTLVAERTPVQNATPDMNLVTQVPPLQALFSLDILVEPIQTQHATSIRGSNSYTTACNCATTSCIDDDCYAPVSRKPLVRSRCPDD